jgi:hypothetical protein
MPSAPPTACASHTNPCAAFAGDPEGEPPLMRSAAYELLGRPHGERVSTRDVDVVLGRERDAEERQLPPPHGRVAAAHGARRRLLLDTGAVDDRDPPAKRALDFESALPGDQQFARRTRFVLRTCRAGRRS